MKIYILSSLSMFFVKIEVQHKVKSANILSTFLWEHLVLLTIASDAKNLVI